MLGATWSRTIDGALDHISTLTTERANALDEITAFLLEHPEHEDDEHLTLARLALL